MFGSSTFAFGSAYAVDHCELSGEVTKQGLDGADFQEAVMERTGQIVAGAYNGKGAGKPHKLLGVELVAVAVANEVVKRGARNVASDLGVSLDDLTNQAASQHISFC